MTYVVERGTRSREDELFSKWGYKHLSLDLKEVVLNGANKAIIKMQMPQELFITTELMRKYEKRYKPKNVRQNYKMAGSGSWIK